MKKIIIFITLPVLIGTMIFSILLLDNSGLNSDLWIFLYYVSIFLISYFLSALGLAIIIRIFDKKNASKSFIIGSFYYSLITITVLVLNTIESHYRTYYYLLENKVFIDTSFINYFIPIVKFGIVGGFLGIVFYFIGKITDHTKIPKNYTSQLFIIFTGLYLILFFLGINWLPQEFAHTGWGG